ncbi:hypothetical protein [Paenibacillus periandrae]|uniref:hypothetical protein n=1 Tax=Paenibacillus periandrae TaxID=1761741 RepID=UPI001F09B45F|nr:hypothetical protein [Paenibacillus periandrae]
MNRTDLIEQLMKACTNSNNNEMTIIESARIKIEVTKDELVQGKIKRHLDLIERAEKKKSKARSTVRLTFQGYDSRALIQHREVRGYLQRLFKIKPHMLYFLDRESNIQSILLCLLETDIGAYGNLFADRQKGHAEFTFYGTDIISHVRKYIEKAVRYASGLKEPASTQKEFITYLLDAIDYERLAEEGESL